MQVYLTLATVGTTANPQMAEPGFWPSQANFHLWCQNMELTTAGLLIIGGVIFAFFGYSMHRLLIALTCGVIGAYFGGYAGESLGIHWPGLIVGALVLGMIGWFVTAWMAALVGALAGALLGASLWNMGLLDPTYAWAGALIGAITIGVLAFVIFRVSVIIFTSVQGAAMFMLGMLGIAYRFEELRPAIDQNLFAAHWALPATLLVLTLIGVFYQAFRGRGNSASAVAPPARA